MAANNQQQQKVLDYLKQIKTQFKLHANDAVYYSLPNSPKPILVELASESQVVELNTTESASASTSASATILQPFPISNQVLPFRI